MSTEALPSAEPAHGRRVSLSLIMPAFNEEANVERAVRRAHQALERITDEFEIIVVDDGSRDRTGEIADQLAAEDVRVRVLHNDRNRSYGYSLKRGIAAARCDWVLHDGMDLPLAPEDFERFSAHFGEADVIVARRRHRDAHSRWRKLTSFVNNRLLRLLFAPKTTDLNFVQFYRRAYVQAVAVYASSPAFVTPELIMRAERSGYRVLEIPAEFRRREHGKAHFGKPKDILWTLKDMLSLRLRTWLRGWNA